MTVRLKEGVKPLVAGDGTQIEVTDTNKVISVLLREENNLIHLNNNHEIYTDLQIANNIHPTDNFEVGVTTGRVLQSNGRPHTGTLLHYETTSGDYCQWLYGTDTNMYFDGGDGNWRQVYYSDQANEIFIRWLDFYWQTKTGATITLDLSSEITPESDFTVNAPTNIKEGQVYILRVNNGSTVYTMTLGNGIINAQGTNTNLTAEATDMFVFLAIKLGGDIVLELQKEIPTLGEGGTKMFFMQSDFSDIATVGASIATWLSEGQTLDVTTFKDAIIMVGIDVYDRLHEFVTDNGNYRISFMMRAPTGVTHGDGTSSCKFKIVRFTFSYSSGTWTYVSSDTTQSAPIVNNYLRTDYDYTTPYTPLYDGSPATKEYVDDNVSGSIKYEDFETATVVGATLTISYFTTQIIPSADFTLVAGTIKEGMQYIVRVYNSGPIAYTMSLGTGVTNPFGEDLTLTASTTTTIVLLATSSISLEIFSVRTANYI